MFDMISGLHNVQPTTHHETQYLLSNKSFRGDIKKNQQQNTKNQTQDRQQILSGGTSESWFSKLICWF